MKKPPSRTADQFVVRFPDGMRDRIAEAAKRNGRSMNAEIIQRLDHSFTPHEERPWEERMVTDVNRAMLAMLSSDEFTILLDRVKRAGGAETVNQVRDHTPSRSDPDYEAPRITASNDAQDSTSLEAAPNAVQSKLDMLAKQNQELRDRLDEVFDQLFKTFKFDREAMERLARDRSKK